MHFLSWRKQFKKELENEEISTAAALSQTHRLYYISIKGT